MAAQASRGAAGDVAAVSDVARVDVAVAHAGHVEDASDGLDAAGVEHAALAADGVAGHVADEAAWRGSGLA